MFRTFVITKGVKVGTPRYQDKQKLCKMIIQENVTRIEQLVTELSSITGLTFERSFCGSNSYYCKERRIRISDHYSKYVERMANTFGDNTAIDLVNPTIDFALKLINKKEWFSKLVDGVSISHIMGDRVGDIEFLSANEEEGWVEVLKKNENRIVKYDFEKIVIN